ncbi:MAG: GNAT family N-acetyltransferase, partial [Propionibacteriales bacterium]|nr:GNAT family N-acetyltransferase [Propionibacteriales bacterium]
MDVTSLGYQTDLALLRLSGSAIEDRGDHLVVRSAHNPGFWWGNFLLLSKPPPSTEAPRWLDAFQQAFGGAEHVALGFDCVDGSVADLAGFAAAGLTVEASIVMTARSVHAPPHLNT